MNPTSNKDKKLSYVSLFSASGVGCYGFKLENYVCVATNEYLQKRLNVQIVNNKCEQHSGYIVGDIRNIEVKNKILDEISMYTLKSNDSIDVLIATPPCQGMSVANHKKNDNEIDRNSLVVESILITKQVLPKVFIFENVPNFLKTGCTSPSKEVKEIGLVIAEELAADYNIHYEVLNFKNYGSKSSRKRTLVIGVLKTYNEFISPIDLFPDYREEVLLRDVIYNFKPLKWGEIDESDILHAFRTYPRHMENWIKDLKQGQNAFDNNAINNRPHKIVNDEIVIHSNKNGDKYTRQKWEKIAPCIHTRNDQLASQNTIHPTQNRVFSVRELMELMTIPKSFKWTSQDYAELNALSYEDKRAFYSQNEMNIRQSIGEAVPTAVFQEIANKIKKKFNSIEINVNIERFISTNNLNLESNLINFLSNRNENYSFSYLSKVCEYSNAKRLENNAYYTSKVLLNKIYYQLPDFDKQEIRILEPSVGVGNFLPYLFKKYENIKLVNLDVMDIDPNSLRILEILLSEIHIPSNFKITLIESDFLKYETEFYYDLIIGNPPFAKSTKLNYKQFQLSLYNKKTTNLASYFLEKSINMSENVCLVLPKNILNTSEFMLTRELLSKFRIDSILDFGEYGFKGVLIETISISINTKKKRNKTLIKNFDESITKFVKQEELTDTQLPYWLLYRNNFFDSVYNKLIFNKFSVFRDRQITNSMLHDQPDNNSVWVIRSRNIKASGELVKIPNYDKYIHITDLPTLKIFDFLQSDNVYLVPNMTYNPRMIKKPKGTIVNGSVALLIPKFQHPSKHEINYFASHEFKEFYRIARNNQTRSLNIDSSSVFFFGLIGENSYE